MSHAHLSELAIAQLLLGGAEPPAGAAGCPTCREALERARRDAASFVRVVGPRTQPAIEARLARRRARWFGAAGLAVAAAAALLWFANRGPIATEPPVIAAKGGPALHVIAHHGAGSEDTCSRSRTARTSCPVTRSASCSTRAAGATCS